MQLSFLSLCFSGVLVFSVLYYCDRSLCFNARAVAQKKMANARLAEEVSLFFSQNEIFHANEFSEVLLFKYSNVLGNT